MKVTLYTLPILGAGFLSIPATQPDRRVEVIEDGSVTPQGFAYKLPNDNFAQTYETVAGQGIILGNVIAQGNAKGNYIGLPIQKDVSQTKTLRAADILLKLTSATATPTLVRVTEYD